jgi:hypothetical protein
MSTRPMKGRHFPHVLAGTRLQGMVATVPYIGFGINTIRGNTLEKDHS